MHPLSLEQVLNELGLPIDSHNNKINEGCILLDVNLLLSSRVFFLVTEELSIDELRTLQWRLKLIKEENPYFHTTFTDRNSQMSQLCDSVDEEIDIHERIEHLIRAINPSHEPYLRNIGDYENAENLITKRQPGTILMKVVCFLVAYVEEVFDGTLFLPKSIFYKYGSTLEQIGIRAKPIV